MASFGSELFGIRCSVYIWTVTVLFYTATETCGYDSDNAFALRFSVLNSYDPVARPDASVDVAVAFHLVHISSVNPVEQSVSLNGYFTVDDSFKEVIFIHQITDEVRIRVHKTYKTWRDTKLKWEKINNFKDIETVHYKDGEIWRPDLVIENQIDHQEVISDENLRYIARYTGEIVWEPPVAVKVYCAMDLTYYPFDKHRCSVVMSSWTYDYSEAPLVALSNTVLLDQYQGNAEWEVDPDTEVVTSQVNTSIGSITRTYSKITFYVTVTRNSWMFGISFLLPQILLSALITVTFLLPAQSGEKASYSITVILAFVLLYIVRFAYLPVSASVSVLVIYSAIVLILACLEVVAVFFILYVYHRHEKMSRRTKWVANFLRKMTCSLRSADDTKSLGISEVTTSTKISEHDLHACSSLPNGGIVGKKHGRLSPINRRVVPVASTHVNDIAGDRATSPRLPDVPGVNQSTAEVQTDSQKHSETGQIAHLQWDGKSHASDDMPNFNSRWQDMSRDLDKLFFVVFLLLHFLVHLICLIVLGVGGG